MNNAIMGNTQFDVKCWAGMVDSLKYTIKSWVKEAMEEVIAERMENIMMEDKLYSATELCERWNINKNTLHSWEKKGVINPLPMEGKKKMYSFRDIQEAEVSGMVKSYN